MKRNFFVAPLFVALFSAACSRSAVTTTTAPTAAPAPTASAAPTLSAAGMLPQRLSSVDYWKLLSDISEPGGYFRIEDNYTSNEMEVGQLYTMLRTNNVSGDVYMGVG